MSTARQLGFEANIVLTTPELVASLQGLPAEIISIDHFFDLAELNRKLSAALL
jgi:hypothetical protein